MPNVATTVTSPSIGTANYIPKYIGVASIGNSQIFDNGTNVGIGTATPSAFLDVSGITVISGLRPITLNPTVGSVRMKASTGGWSMSYGVTGSSGTDGG